MSTTVRTIALLVFIILCTTVNTAAVVAQDNAEITKKYPPERYIHRIGTGETPENASEAARLEIAKYFESKISGESIVKEWAESRTEKGKTTQKYMTELSNTVKVSAEREIPGIEITGTRRNENIGAYEAWAVLEKNAYAAVLTERITTLDSEINQSLSGMPGDDLRRLRNLNKALHALIDREQDRRDLALLNPGGTPESRNNILQEVITSIDSLVSEAFDVGLVYDGEVDSEIRTGLIKGIVDAGIRLREYPDLSSANSAGSDLVMSVKHDVISKTRTSKIGSKEFVITKGTWVLSVTAYDPETEKAIDTIVQNKNFSEVGDETLARERMVNKILDSQVPEVSSWVYRLIFQPAEN